MNTLCTLRRWQRDPWSKLTLSGRHRSRVLLVLLTRRPSPFLGQLHHTKCGSNIRCNSRRSCEHDARWIFLGVLLAAFRARHEEAAQKFAQHMEPQARANTHSKASACDISSPFWNVLTATRSVPDLPKILF